jgi:predicted acetyltransferase
MWQWLLSIDLLARVKVDRAPVPGPLFLALTEPRRLGLTVSDGLWLRFVDMPAALRERSYARAGSLTFELTDEFVPSNAGRWRLDVSEYGEAAVTPFDGEPDVRLDTADLAATYLGGFTFASLALAGRVEERRPGAIADADGLFISAVTPWCSTGF